MALDFPQIEQKILKFWQDNKIFEKTLKKTKKGAPFIFFEGPPFANGLPGIHHLLSRAFKDIILRYKTMQGFYVGRKAGWDTHGLPTEMAAEKKLGIKNKRDIEKIGVEKFIKECENSVFTYKKEWEDFSERIGFWLDFKSAYITCSNDYIETLWWILKQIWQKGLLYQDYKVVPYCPRCGTSLSSHEVAQGYKTVKENSIYVKFPAIEEKNTYFLAWTTTPWTLPGNSAIYVDRATEYVKIEVEKGGKRERYVLAKPCLKIINEKYTIIQKLNAKDLIGRRYKPLFPYFEGMDPKYYHIDEANFVKTEQGTGLVHSAIMYGEEDFERAKQQGLKENHIIDENGRVKDSVPLFKGMFFKDADPYIIKHLENKGIVYKTEETMHEYPFCWRCDSPLIYYAKKSWFIKMTAVKDDLIKNSQKINWIPEHIKEGRFGEWLEEIKDWNLSRERYWGTPLPIWKCEKCGNYECVGSIKELEDKSGQKIENVHKPFIDEVVFKCEKCGGQARRVSEVIDCWFDSGAMPFAQWHYPFENKNKIDKKEFFPADFIAEGIDQTRGWFYTLLAISTLLRKESPYKNVICLGLVLDSLKQKMSKSKGNIILPEEVINKFGADCARLYFYTVNQAGEEKRFDFREVEELYRKFFNTLWQSYIFFSLYRNKNFKPKKDFKPKSLLDKWIISRLENINLKVIRNLDNFDIVSAARLFLDFVEDLSKWYIRRSRRKLQKPENEEVKKEAENTLYYVVLKLSQLIAPFVPFFAEELYRNLDGNEESVHLSKYPASNKELINLDLEEKMKVIRGIITQVLAERVALGIKVRQPLSELKIKNSALKDEKELLELIKEEVNVKKITFNERIEKEIELDAELTEELKEEGIIREAVRQIQEMRKKKGLTPADKISIYASGDDSLVRILNKNKKLILTETKAEGFNIEKKSKEMFDIKKEIMVDKQKIWLAIKQVHSVE